MQIHQRSIAGRLRIAVGHADHHGLLQAKDVAEVVGKVAEHRQFGRARVAEDGSHAEAAQKIEGGVAHGDKRERGAGHAASPYSSRQVWEPPALPRY